MALRCYLAMTAAEFCTAEVIPAFPGWMACHFSSYGLGLSNLPRSLPEGAMVIVNDRTPINGHDPELILEQLTALLEQQRPSCFLLDFQRPGEAQTEAVAKCLTEQLPCPVGVTAYYAESLSCPIFLSPPPLHIPLSEYLTPWKGREIWLEAATDAETITVTAEGSRFTPAVIEKLEEPYFAETMLHCRYHTSLAQDAAVFTLLRDRQELTALLAEAEKLGVGQAVGLYQQLEI